VPNASEVGVSVSVELVAAGTVIVILGASTPSNEAPIVVVRPPVTAVTSPLALIVAAAGLEEVHVTLLVKS
jgi:hypothetical protein